MHWIIFGIFGVIATTVANLFQKIAMKDEKSDPVISAIFFQFILGFVTSFFTLVKGFYLPDASLIPYFLCSGALYATGSICFFRAIKYIEASEMTILGGFSVLVTILASIIFLSDKLTLIQLSGAALILLAVVVISWRKNEVKISTGMWLALGGAVSYGMAVVFDSYIVKRYSAVSFLPLASFIPGTLLMLFYIRRIPDVIKAIPMIDKNLIIYGVIYSFSAIAFYQGLESGALVGQMSAIWRASVVLTVIFASIFLHESKHIGQKIVGAVLATIGVLLVT
ncbi:DMT family transporter [Candidatus Gottesmanbacteria bacterium]|nr:DMT family transporter [Candidatus Gottesmanbacteria bacterium]